MVLGSISWALKLNPIIICSLAAKYLFIGKQATLLNSLSIFCGNIRFRGIAWVPSGHPSLPCVSTKRLNHKGQAFLVNCMGDGTAWRELVLSCEIEYFYNKRVGLFIGDSRSVLHFPVCWLDWALGLGTLDKYTRVAQLPAKWQAIFFFLFSS